MAHVQSLGVHEPSALPYLIDESLLPNQPLEASYTWQVYPVYDDTGKEITEEEVLQTKTCVVWSRGGIVKRAFNLDVEGEKILHAFVTRFPSRKTTGHPSTETASRHGAAVREGSRASERLQSSSEVIEEATGQALVVILKTKAHIYFLSGDTHIISLPFDVGVAFPTPRGCLLQRKTSTSVINPSSLSAPQNSFVSSQLSSNLTKSQPITLKTASSSRPSLTLSPVGRDLPVLSTPHNDHLPSVFSLTDPQSDLGVAVRQVQAQTINRIATDHVEQRFDPAEEILYTSRSNEVTILGTQNLEPLFLAVSWNAMSGTVTVWKVKYRDRDSFDSPTKRRKVSHDGPSTRKRSSNVFTVSGSTTPVGRGRGESRESLGAQLGRSFPESHLSYRYDDHKSSDVETFATELGPDFAEVGVQTRAARRVSSLLARTDLSMGPDRASVNGFAASNPGRKSLNRVGPRGESMGEFRDRQSFGVRPRNSLPGINSFRGNETSFADAPDELLLEGLGLGGEFEGFENMVLDEAMGDLAAETVFTKVHSIPSQSPRTVNQSAEANFNVFTLATPPFGKHRNVGKTSVLVCIMDSKKGELSVITFEAVPKSATSSEPNKPQSREKVPKGSMDLTTVNVQRVTNVLDACKIRDGDHSCMLVLTRSSEGQIKLLLEAVGISSFRLDLPSPLVINDPYGISPANQTDRRREVGRGRVLKATLNSISAFQNTSIRGQVDLVESKSHLHRLQLQLEPRHSQVKKVLETVEFATQDKGGGGVYVAWIEVMRWLQLKGSMPQMEWSAMVITLFSMIVPFISDKQAKGRPGSRTKKAGVLRSSSGATISMSRWDEMVNEECGVAGTSPAWSTCPGWQWTGRETDMSKSHAQQRKSLKSSSTTTTQAPFEGKRNMFLIQCASWTREFMQTPVGEKMLGLEGFLPTASNQNRESRRAAVGSILIALHLLREEQKLDIRSSRFDGSGVQLAPILAQIGQWLNWKSWGAREGSYYHAEITDVEYQVFDDNAVTTLDLVSQPMVPPSIFEFVEASFCRLQERPFLTLLDVIGSRDPARTQVLMSRVKSLTPRTSAVLKFFSQFALLESRPAKVEWMCKCGLDAEILATLPVGISASFYDAISSCEGSPPPSWSKPLLQLIGRDDLKSRSSFPGSYTTTTKSHNVTDHEAIRDYHSIGSLILDTEPSHSWDASSEADRQGVTRLIFRDDRRFQDASRLVNQLRIPVAECHPEPDWTEADLLDAQRELVQLVIMRTMTVSSGRGMMNYSSRVPLLTEKLPVPAFTLQCQVRPSNVTFNADRAAFTEDRAVWAFFHNGTAAGLTISKDARGIDTSWILFNKPPELTNRHAGFLLALGLNGHLKSLAKWVAFKYLTPKHTMTSIGLLLGLSASYLGTMDTLITRLLSVHVTRMLPPGAAELNLSPLTQTTGIMGIGLLYCSSQHRRMSEVMLSEIENNDIEEGVPSEQTLRDEGYRLAAGFALGFINLGQGKRLHGLHDMNVMERLLTIAIGTKNVNLVHILDRATSGATIAFALIYMKTNDQTIARKIDIPDTPHQFDYVRPDIFLLRTVAHHLILWSSIQPTFEFIRSSLPKPYRHRASLSSTRHLNTEDLPFFHILAGLCLALGLRFAGSGSHTVRDLLTSYLDQFLRLTALPALNYDAKLTRNAVRNCQDVTALATAAVMAGTGDIVVFRRLRSLHGRQDPDTPYGSHLAAHMAIGVLFLGGGTYVLGTSDVAIAALLCAFYPLFPTSVMDNQAHLQAFRHLWVLAAEPRCVVPRDVETGRAVSVPIVVSLKDENDDAAAAEEQRKMTAPCLIPDLDTIREIRTDAKGYWAVTISFCGAEGERRKSDFKTGGHLNLFLRRRAPYDAANEGSVFVSEMQALAERGPAPSVGLTAAVPTQGKFNPFEWLWDLEAFKELDVSERALVLPHALMGMGMGMGMGIGGGGGGGGQGNRYLRGTVVDARLELEHGILDEGSDGKGGLYRDKLWQLRLLFAWVDALEREEERRREREREREGKGDGESEKESEKETVERKGGAVRQQEAVTGTGNWLRRDVIEKLRWRVWKMGAGVEGGDEVEDGDQDGGQGDDDADER